ncbi:hypothetical protein ACX80V_16920 [Arthrobacter sp. MDT3-24]
MTDSSEDDPLFMRLLEQQLTALERLYEASESLEEALENISRQRDGAIAELRGIVANLDAFDVIANLYLVSLPTDIDSYVESQHESLPSLTELAALLLAEREPRVVGDVTQTGGQELEDLHGKLRALLDLEAIRLHVELQKADEVLANDHDTPTDVVPPRIESRMRLSIVSAELYMRNRQYMDKERTLLLELFSPPAIDLAVREFLGYGVVDLLELFDSTAGWLQRKLVDSGEEARTFLEEQLAVNEDVRAVIEATGLGDAEALDHLVRAAVFQQIAGYGSFSADELAGESTMDAALLVKMLSDFSIDLELQSENVVSGYLAGDNLVKRKPFASRIVDGERRWILIQPTSLLYATRPALENALKRSRSATEYSDHRGELLESKGLAELVKVLKPDIGYQSVYYQDRDETQEFEGDGLLFIDRFAIIVEMKSKPLSPASLRGNPGRMFLDLKKIILDADEQARRLRALLNDGQLFRLRRATLLNSEGQPHSQVQDVDIPIVPGREVLTITLSLDNLNAVSTVVEELTRSGLLSGQDDPPWIVNQHDLEIITEVLGRPSEFIHYLLRRREMNISGSFRASEELDYFMRYLTTGLYTEPGQPGIAMLPSQTDRLDAWYEYSRGDRAIAAEKPQQPIPAGLAGLLDSLNEHRPYGWLSTSIDLLDLDGPLRREIGDLLLTLRRESRMDRKMHTKFVGFGIAGPGKRRGILFLSFARGVTRDNATREASSRLRLRKHALRLDYLAAIGVWDSTETFNIFVFNDEPWQPNPALDELARRAGYELAE